MVGLQIDSGLISIQEQSPVYIQASCLEFVRMFYLQVPCPIEPRCYATMHRYWQPKKSIECTVLQFLKQYRKAYLTKFARIFYSQFGEDVVLRSLIGKQKRGVYVDVGCFHPKRFSNTYFLYRRGWRGINIDMEEHKIALFNIARRGDHNVTAAVSDVSQPLYISTKRAHALESALSIDAVAGAEVIPRTLTSIIDESPYRNASIDVLSVDAEGHDINVLRSLDYSRYRPRIVIAEVLTKRIEEVLTSDVHVWLSQRGYLLRSWTICSLIYVLED